MTLVMYRMVVMDKLNRSRTLHYVTGQDADVASVAEKTIRAIKRVEQARDVTVVDCEVEQ